MTAMPVEWHKRCRDSVYASLLRLEEAKAKLQQKIDRTKEDLELRDRQIETAIREKKLKFDSDRYLIDRKLTK